MPMLSSNEDGSKEKRTDTYNITNDPIEFRIKSADISTQCNSPSDIIFFESEESRYDVVKKLESTPVKERNSSEQLPDIEMLNMTSFCDGNESIPVNDSGIVIGKSMAVIDSDDDNVVNHSISERNTGSSPEKNGTKCSEVVKIGKKNKGMKKPLRPCLFCSKLQSHLKRHILAKHKNEKNVSSILHLGEKEQNHHHINMMRKQAIKIHNLKEIENSGNEFMRERRNTLENEGPVMCIGCMGFYSKSFKARHQLNCPGTGTNVMIPMISINSPNLEKYPDNFKELLQTLQQDSIGNYIKQDPILLSIGYRSFESLRRKKDNVTEGRKTV